MFNILDYGVKSDGITKCTQQIQSAIDSISASGGGVLRFPAGTYLTGTILLKSHVTLYLDPGSLILGSTDWRDYPELKSHCEFPANWLGFGVEPNGVPEYEEENKTEKSRFRVLIGAEDAEDIGIEGYGTIDGQGQYGKYLPYRDNPQRKRPYLFFAYGCRHIHLKGITMKNPGFWVVSCNCSEYINIDGVTTDAWDSIIGDCLDFDGSSNVSISNCFLRSGDDAISLKSYTKSPCKNYVITNCVIECRWAAVRFGVDAMSETANVTMNNCVIKEACDGIKIQSGMGADIHDVCIDNIVMEKVHRPIFITLSRSRLSIQNDSVRPTIGRIHGITLSNIRAKMPTDGEVLFQNLVAISGTPERKIENLILNNICIEYEGRGTEQMAKRYDIPEFIDYGEFYAEAMQFKGELPTCGFYLRHIEELIMDNCQVVVRNEDKRPAVFAYCVDDLVLRNFFVKGEVEGVLRALQCGEITMSGCRAGKIKQDLPLSVDSDSEKKLQCFAAMTWDCHLMFEKMAKLTDAAEAVDVISLVSGWQTESDKCVAVGDIPASAKYIHFQMLYGNMTLLFDDEEIGMVSIPKTYRTKTMASFAIPQKFCGKCVKVSVIWEDPDDIGGYEAKMPFGDDFVPCKAGLYDDVEIRG